MISGIGGKLTALKPLWDNMNRNSNSIEINKCMNKDQTIYILEKYITREFIKKIYNSISRPQPEQSEIKRSRGMLDLAKENISRDTS